MNTIDETLLNEVKKKLIDVYHPEYIYLFGSYAWGTPDNASDYDLLIVIKNSELSMADRIRLGLSALRNINIPFDILVYTIHEFEQKKDHPSALTNKIVKNGIKLYEAA